MTPEIKHPKILPSQIQKFIALTTIKGTIAQKVTLYKAFFKGTEDKYPANKHILWSSNVLQYRHKLTFSNLVNYVHDSYIKTIESLVK